MECPALIDPNAPLPIGKPPANEECAKLYRAEWTLAKATFIEKTCEACHDGKGNFDGVCVLPYTDELWASLNDIMDDYRQCVKDAE